MDLIFKKTIGSTLKITTGLFMALFFGIISANAMEVEDFFGYTLGNVDGQGKWHQSANQYEVSDSSECDDYCLDSKSADNLTTYRDFASSTRAIVKIGLKAKNFTASPIDQVVIKIYQGNPTGGGALIVNQALRKDPSGDGVAIWQHESVALANNTAGYIYLDIDCQADTLKMKADSGAYVDVTLTNNCDYIDYIGFLNNSAPDVYINSITWDYFEPGEVIIEELPEYVGTIQIGSETIIQYNRNNFCFLDINQPCYLKFNYGYDSIGSDIYLLDQDYNIVASSTISEGQLLLQDRFLIAEPEQEETQLYCISMNNDGEIKTWCDISLDWVNNEWCDTDQICADVATSSDFLYGFQCGFRQGACWLFTPTSGSIEFFTKSIDNFTNSFPFNLAFGLINEAETAIASSSGGASFGVPMYSATTSSYYTLTGIDQYTYQEILGTSTMSTLETQADIIVYLIFGLAIVFIIYRFAIIKR